MLIRKRLLLGAIPLIPVVIWLGLCGYQSSAQSSPILAPYKWEPVRIVAGGYIPGLIAHPTQPGLIYARTDIGSAYRWNPTLRQWIPLTDFHAPGDYNLQGPESIALDPTDPTRLYIAAGMYSSGEAAILVSTDQGNTFTTNPVSFSMASNGDDRSAGERLAVNPFQPSQLLMGTRSGGLWVSNNYGQSQSWSKVAGFPISSSNDGFGLQFVVFDPSNKGVVYVGAYTTSLVYKSTDGGITWSALPAVTWPYSVPGKTRNPTPNRGVVNPDGNLYVTFSDDRGPSNMSYGAVEKYNPQTSSWTNVTPPDYLNSPRGGFCGLTQDRTSQGTVAVTTLDRWYPVDTVYITHDGGNTWVDLGATTSANGVDGPPNGNYYFAPSVFMPVSPWLTFGNTSYPTSPTPTAKFGWWMSAVLIDPTNPNHLMFGTGATLYATDNVSAADSGQAPTWYVQGLGIEETAVLALISPTQGAHLLSGVGDIGGFRHDNLAVSPAGGMYTNPVMGNTGSLDWAGQNPLFVTRVGSPNSASTSPCTYGGYSTDGGTTWQPFDGCAAGGSNGNAGTIAVDASGTMMMWTTTGGSVAPQYSTDNGGGWSVTSGMNGLFSAVADKVTPQLFYAFDEINFYSTTTSKGTVFTKVNQTSLPTGVKAVPVANFARAGDLWLPLGGYGLFHSTDGGVTWKQAASVLQANLVAVGAANPHARTGLQSIFVYGAVSTTTIAIYRSDDNGSTWVRVNDDAHQYGGPTVMTADPRVYGRVYIGMNGRGIVYGDILHNALGGTSARPQ
jgi:oligoxyloglucan reducing-end-specific cellobiohydrolase